MAVDWDEVRSDFPVLKRFRYFYTASGGPLPRPVFEASADAYRQYMEWGDSKWEQNVERREGIRSQAAQLIGALPEEVEFAGSTAAAMNIIAYLLAPRGEVIAPRLEFPDSTLPWLNQRPGCVRWVAPDHSGAVPVTRMRQAMTPGTTTLVTSHVQYSNGFRQDLAKLGRAKQGHRLVVNATQSLGAFQLDVRKMQIDALASNSYKWLLGGYGCGILYLSKQLLEETLQVRPCPGVGWFGVRQRDQNRNDRFEPLPQAARFNWGSPSFPAIFALGAAIGYLQQIGMEAIQQRVLELNRYLTDRLSSRGFRLLSPLTPDHYRSAQTLVALESPQRVVGALAEKGILCTVKPEGMRVATHFFVSLEDIDRLVETLADICGSRR